MTRLLPIWSRLRAGVRALMSGLWWLAFRLVGRLKWEPPAWGRWTGTPAAGGWRYVRARPALAAGVVAVLAAAQPYEWRDAGEIGQEILNAAPPVALAYVPSEEGGNTSHGFKFRAHRRRGAALLPRRRCGQPGQT